MSKILVPVLLVCLMLAACATTPAVAPPSAIPSVPPAPTMAAVPPTNTVAPTMPPTNAPQPTNTTVPTETLPATASPTRAPLPQVSRELLLGTWWQFDSQAQGNNYLIFKVDGSFKGRHGPDPKAGILVSEGTFTLQQDELIITDKTDCPNGDTYRIRFTTKDHLFFKFLSSTCGSTAEDFTRQPNWDRLPNAQ